MNNSQKVRNVLIRFRNRDISQEDAENLLIGIMDSIKIDSVIECVNTLGFQKLTIDYAELAKSILESNHPNVKTTIEEVVLPLAIQTSEKEKVTEDHGSFEQMEIIMIKKSLEKNKGHRKIAAAELGISERTLYRKINDYNLVDFKKIKP